MGKQTRCQVRDIINSHHPSLVLLYETHGAFAKVERMWLSLGYKLVFIQEARGHSRGIWILSNSIDLKFTLIDSMSQAITFTISKGIALWYCTAIYGSPVYTIRTSLWTHLKNLCNNVTAPRLMIGDFNEIKSVHEVSGGSFNLARVNLFVDMINHCNLLDMDAEGGFFTWRLSTQTQTHIRKRLDRCMMNVDWRLAFPHALVEILSPHNSDHNPVLLSCSKSRSIKSNMFHFHASWISHPDFEPLIDNTWNTFVGTTASKLKQIQAQSITFNKETFDNIFKNKRIIWKLGLEVSINNWIITKLLILLCLRGLYNKNIIRSWHRCFGTKSLVKIGSNLETKILNSSMPRLLSEDVEIKYLGLMWKIYGARMKVRSEGKPQNFLCIYSNRMILVIPIV